MSFHFQSVFDEISAQNPPDVVRLVDCNVRSRRGEREPEPKYKNDENVIKTIPAQYKQIEVGS